MECSICKDNEKPVNIMTSCNHSFHRDCLTSWMDINDTCPYCKVDLSEDKRAEKKFKNLKRSKMNYMNYIIKETK